MTGKHKDIPLELARHYYHQYVNAVYIYTSTNGSGGIAWVAIALTDLGYPNSVLPDYPCITALPFVASNDVSNINSDVFEGFRR